MALEIQFKIKENEYYLKYLRMHDYWYKVLNRNPKNFNKFKEEVKQAYKLSKANKLQETMKNIEMFEKILSTLS